MEIKELVVEGWGVSNHSIQVLPVGAVWEHIHDCHVPTEAFGCCVLSESLLFEEYRDL